MKKSSLLLTTAVIAGAGISGVDAKAYDFNEKIYGKASASIGYSFQSAGSDTKRNMIDNAGDDINTKFHNISFGIGFDTYYKLSNTIHPFIGLDIEGRVPVKTDIIQTHWSGGSGKDFWKINDFLSTHLKFGAKFNISQNVAISPYGLIGFNLIQSSSQGYVGIDADGNLTGHSPFATDDANQKYNLSKTYIGLSTGFGINLIYAINNNLSLFGAIEYQFHTSNSKINSYHHLVYDKFVGGNDAETWAGAPKIKKYQLHQFGVKFGVQFL